MEAQPIPTLKIAFRLDFEPLGMPANWEPCRRIGSLAGGAGLRMPASRRRPAKRPVKVRRLRRRRRSDAGCGPAGARAQGGAYVPRAKACRAYVVRTYFLGSLYRYLYMSRCTEAVLAYSMTAQRSALNVEYR